jgi:hypothetical protein
MHGTIPHRVREQREIERTLARGDARLCVSLFGQIMKLIYEYKTADQMTADLGGSKRAHEYELSGERPPSPEALILIQQKIMENFKANRSANERSRI